MSLRRFFVADRIAAGAELRLGEDAARYLGRVLRLRAEDTVHVFNGDDGEWLARISRIGKNQVRLVVGEKTRNEAESHLRTHLVQGISRGERMDFVVQKATELGVKRVTPVLTDHGVVKLDPARASKRREHWQRVAAHACEQCGRFRPPLIDAPLPLRDWFGGTRDRDATELILHPNAATSLSRIESPQTKLCLLTGPEGGFSEREYEDAGVAGFTPVSLGPRILRTETAAVAALSIAQSLWGDL
jgi:16S rRNA (uracil1498-N3)-methyltransferase